MKKKNLKIVMTLVIIILFFTINNSTKAISLDQEYIIITKNFNLMSYKQGSTLYVGGDGPNNYSKIQDAIDNASDGDTVFVFNGTYSENIKIGNTINLVGEDKNITIINGSRGPPYPQGFIQISGDWVNVRGFTIIQSLGGFPDSGIALLHSHHSTIEDNIIAIRGGGSNPGIYLDCSHHNTIKDNIIRNCSSFGFEIWFSDYNSITGNIIANNRGSGITIRSSQKLYISNNTIINNKGYGINLGNCYETIVSDNAIADNRYSGIHVYWMSLGNIITGNNITNNSDYGVEIILTVWYCPCNSNLIYHNNFIDNMKNAFDECDNQWFNFSLRSCSGNYWDDYKGNDKNGDGIGDTPYQIPGGKEKDRFPLMKPYNGTITIHKVNRNNQNIQEKRPNYVNHQSFGIWFLQFLEQYPQLFPLLRHFLGLK